MKNILFTFYFIVSCSISNAQNYSDSLKKLRKEHLTELLDTSSAILQKDEIKVFTGLDYFDIDESFKVSAIFTLDKGKKFKMATSTDRAPIYRRYGYVDFTINNQKQRLTVYQNIALIKTKGFEDYLFIPFRDSTSAKSTYGGGRYLDIQIPTTNTVILDFNLAYNPYCAYSHRYSCPIPPIENTLFIEIEAGEKYVEHE